MNYRKENKRRLRKAHQARKATAMAAVLAIRKEVTIARRKLKRKMRKRGFRSFAIDFHARHAKFEMPKDYVWLPDGTRLSLSMAEGHFT